MLYKKDFKALISELKRTRAKAKKDIKHSVDKKHNGEYSVEFRASDEKNDGIITMCNRVLDRIEKILSK